MQYTIGDLFISKTGNVFKLSKIIDDKVKLERIGIINDGDFVERLGVPALVSCAWLESSETTMAPAVRCLGNVIIPLEKYLLKYDRD